MLDCLLGVVTVSDPPTVGEERREVEVERRGEGEVGRSADDDDASGEAWELMGGSTELPATVTLGTEPEENIHIHCSELSLSKHHHTFCTYI